MSEASASQPLRTALFVVDVQADMADDPKSEVPDAVEIRSSLKELIERARQINRDHIGRAAKDGVSDSLPPIQLVFVQHDDDNPDDPLAHGKPSWQLVFPPRTEDGDWLYHKNKRDTFECNPDLADRLRQAGATNLGICGLQSEYCVRSATLGALASGFDKITLLSGAHSTYPSDDVSLEQMKQNVEQEMAQKGVSIVPWQSWLTQITAQ